MTGVKNGNQGNHTDHPDKVDMDHLTSEEKVFILERILRNLYHAREIRWYLHFFEDMPRDIDSSLHGHIELLDVEDITAVPTVCPECDSGLSQSVRLDIKPNENKPLDPREFEPMANIEINVTTDPWKIIDKLANPKERNN